MNIVGGRDFPFIGWDISTWEEKGRLRKEFRMTALSSAIRDSGVSGANCGGVREAESTADL